MKRLINKILGVFGYSLKKKPTEPIKRKRKKKRGKYSYTVEQYLKKVGILEKLSHGDLIKIGKESKRLSEEAKLPITATNHPKYGQVYKYKSEILKQVVRNYK